MYGNVPGKQKKTMKHQKTGQSSSWRMTKNSVPFHPIRRTVYNPLDSISFMTHPDMHIHPESLTIQCFSYKAHPCPQTTPLAGV